jgi:GntR family transcriptional regulator
MDGEPHIQIDLGSPEPAYRQVAGQVRALIVSGALRPGDTLPGVRRLAMDLGVHFNTVAEAYRQLGEEGLVEVNQGKSARILARRAGPVEAEALARFSGRLRGLLGEMRAAGVSPDEIRRLVEGELS